MQIVQSCSCKDYPERAGQTECHSCCNPRRPYNSISFAHARAFSVSKKNRMNRETGPITGETTKPSSRMHLYRLGHNNSVCSCRLGILSVALLVHRTKLYVIKGSVEQHKVVFLFLAQKMYLSRLCSLFPLANVEPVEPQDILKYVST